MWKTPNTNINKSRQLPNDILWNFVSTRITHSFILSYRGINLCLWLINSLMRARNSKNCLYVISLFFFNRNLCDETVLNMVARNQVWAVVCGLVTFIYVIYLLSKKSWLNVWIFSVDGLTNYCLIVFLQEAVSAINTKYFRIVLKNWFKFLLETRLQCNCCLIQYVTSNSLSPIFHKYLAF